MRRTLVDGDPQRVGGYWLAGRLGAGGQGVVYEAYDGDGTRVAVKLLHGHAAGQVRREVAAAQRVASFCTARVLAADLDADRPYIVTEYVPGASLREAVAAGRRFAGDELHRLATAIATAVAAIHDAGVVHRDLKPGNVLLGPDGPRVIDFGVARTEDMTLTASGVAAGTPTYMAPEVFTGERAGRPADIFAWGAVVLFAATSTDPFHADGLGAVIHRVLSADPDLSVLPDSLRNLVGAALAKDPAARPTAGELLPALISGDGRRLDLPRLLAAGARRAGAIASGVSDDPALGALAEDCYAGLSPGGREAARQVFLRLVTVGEDGELLPRRAPREELEEQAGEVLEAFAYLLTTGEEIALARPALPQAWPRLRGWIAANRDGLAVHRHIATAARRWNGRGRRDGDLLQGDDLDGALRWAATDRRDITLTPMERDFLTAGAALARRRVRRGRLVTVTMAALLVAALVGGGLAVWQGRQISVQRDEAEARRLAAAAEDLRALDPNRAMLLSVAAWRLAPVPEARAALVGSLTGPEVAAFRDPAPDALRLLSRDGRTLVSVGDGEARVWDVRTGTRTGRFPVGDDRDGRIVRAALSPGAQGLAVATERGIRVWDVRTGRPYGTRRPLAPDAEEFDLTLGYGEAEHIVIVGQGQGATAWDVRTGREVHVPTLGGDVTTSEDGATVFYAFTGKIFRKPFPAGEAERLRDDCRPPCAMALTPDGRTLIISDDPDPVMIDAVTGRERDEATPGDWADGAPVLSHDGRLLTDGRKVWRLGGEDPLDAVLELGRGGTPAFDPDGRTLRVLADDTVVSYDAGPPGSIVPVTGSSRLSPDGGTLATEEETRVLLWDTATGKPAGPGVDLGTDDVDLTVVSDDGGLLAVRDDNGRITVHDTRTGRHATTLTEDEPTSSRGMTFSPDGTRLAVAEQYPAADGESRVRLVLWELRTARRLWTWSQSAEVDDLRFTPDGRTIAVRGPAGIVLVDAASGKTVDAGQLFGPGARRLDFSASGAFHARQDDANRLWVWPPGAARPRTLVLEDTPQDISAVELDGSTAVISDGSALSLWDTATGRSIGRVPLVSAMVGMPVDGRLLLLGDDFLRALPLDPDRLITAVCARARAGSPPQNRRTSLPNTRYEDVCGQGKDAPK
ncbi:serine/threonine-protein kinase [Nonomuraea sp. SYSU D8015]|uniref:serine/threonine-protein kinase n=1 Tax=Nonomuraea sp. SYSU D8015 TaxID=2593644 RepID=UPI001661413B|nr:WD40 repeat domain-containing serine/threonine protein kinase [Nonomuraea sp. SYSU D8015]